MGDIDPLAVAGVREALQGGLRQTSGLFRNLTRTTANTAAKQFENALDRAWLQVTSGAFDYNTAIRNAVKDLARTGVQSITYPTSHVDTIETAVRRAVVTGVNQTAAKSQLALMDDLEIDLVEVTAHAGARPSHQDWQGQVYCRKSSSRAQPASIYRIRRSYFIVAGLLCYKVQDKPVDAFADVFGSLLNICLLALLHFQLDSLVCALLQHECACGASGVLRRRFFRSVERLQQGSHLLPAAGRDDE